MLGLTAAARRATFLATVMVIAAVAMGMGGAGTVAAGPGGPGGGGDSGGDTIIVEPGESIQDAENNASAGDTIKVKDGLYEEKVQVDTEDITIEAYDPDNPPTVRYEPNEPRSNATFEILANGVRLSNLTIERVGHPDRIGNNSTAAVAIIPIDADRPTCTLCNDVTKDVVVEDSEIVGDFPLNDSNAGVAITDGIKSWKLEISGEAKNITIRNNEIHQFSGGIGLVSEFGGTISGIDIVGNHIHDNLAEYNGTNLGTGIGFARNDTQGSIKNVLVTGNNITQNHYGVRVAGNETNETLEDVDASEITVDRNDIKGNSEWGAVNNGTNVLDATDNYWGASDGPSGAGDGSGDKVSTDVDYDPWLQEPVT